jgi:hypothetical protein
VSDHVADVERLLAEHEIPDVGSNRERLARLIEQHGLDYTERLMREIHGHGPVTIGKVRHAWRPSAIGGKGGKR